MKPFLLSMSAGSRSLMRSRTGRGRALTLVLILAIGAQCSSRDDTRNEEVQAHIKKTADDVLALLQEETTALGRAQLARPHKQVEPFLEKINAAGNLVIERGKELDGGAFKLFVEVSLRRAGLKSSPSGFEEGPNNVPELLEEARELKLHRQDREDFADDVRRLLSWIGQVVFVSEKGITDQLVPADSLLRKDWDKNGDGRIDVPLPPFRKGSGRDWQAFHHTLGQHSITEPIDSVLSAVRNAPDGFKIGE